MNLLKIGAVVNFRDRITILLAFTFLASSLAGPQGFAQENLVTSSLASPSVSAKEKLHALALTRFHFITLKHFHSALFSPGREHNSVSEPEAYILNAALNHFLTSPGRETMLLDALRNNKAVRLEFFIPKEEKEYEMIRYRDKAVLYRLEPTTRIRKIPATIEVRPLLDKPIAFQITLRKDHQRFIYDVDWSGKIICMTCP
ncbi:MAG: hypothetical protein HY584_01885 [Candidatus Omnitrophica bacterium]|nr:hypothetical protein [Candidatus Omnitrophota bacterium]